MTIGFVREAVCLSAPRHASTALIISRKCTRHNLPRTNTNRTPHTLTQTHKSFPYEGLNLETPTYITHVCRQDRVPWKPGPRGDRECPKTKWGVCNGVGNCHYDIGVCQCPAGACVRACVYMGVFWGWVVVPQLGWVGGCRGWVDGRWSGLWVREWLRGWVCCSECVPWVGCCRWWLRREG